MHAKPCRLVCLIAVVAALGAARASSASLLTLVGSTLSLGLDTLPPAVAPQEPALLLLSVSSGGGTFTLPASVFAGTLMLPTALFTGVPIINGLTATFANPTQPIAPGAAGAGRVAHLIRPGGGLGGPGALQGLAVVNVLGLGNLSIPLSAVGNTGATTSVFAGTLAITVAGTGWTTASVQVTGVTTTSLASNTVFATGSDERTPGHLGVVRLVSPFKVITNVAGNLAGLATQTLTFVPEAGALVLLVSGALTLAILGSRRRG